jgi:hypothetical protein
MVTAACNPVAMVSTASAASSCKPAAEKSLQRIEKAVSKLGETIPPEYADAIRASTWTACMHDHGMECPDELTLAKAPNGEKITAAPACGDPGGGDGGAWVTNPWKFPKHLKPPA